MPLLCQTCNQSPFPDLPQWYYETKGRSIIGEKFGSRDTLPYAGMENKLKQYIKDLKKELGTAKRALKAVQVLAAPIHELPDEILLLIFDWIDLSAGEDDLDHFYGCCTQPDIHQISLVCRRWRSIVTSTSKFWTTIVWDDPSSSQPGALANQVEVQMKRAGKLPLRLSLLGLRALADPLNLFGQGFSRITELNLGLYYQLSGDIFASCTLPPSLTHLYLHVQNDSALDGVVPWVPISIDIAAHPVAQLKFVDMFVTHPLQRLILPWNQLTTFDIILFDCGDVDIFAVISGLERAEAVKIDVEKKDPEPSDFITTRWSAVALPHLRDLSLVIYQEDDVACKLLQYATFSSLKMLKLNTRRETFTFAALHNPHLRTITKLELSIESINGQNLSESLVTALSGFKRLESFQCKLPNAPHYDELVLQAMCIEDDEALFPLLTSLEITKAVYGAQSLTLLRSMLQRRVSGVNVPIHARKALQTIVFSYRRPDNDDHFGPPRELPLIKFQPPYHNDQATLVGIRGYFPTGFVENIFNVIQPSTNG